MHTHNAHAHRCLLIACRLSFYTVVSSYLYYYAILKYIIIDAATPPYDAPLPLLCIYYACAFICHMIHARGRTFTRARYQTAVHCACVHSLSNSTQLDYSHGRDCGRPTRAFLEYRQTEKTKISLRRTSKH